jgi:hypothetical protein
MSQIGTVISGRHAEQAVIDLLKDYLLTYLADRARDRDLPASRFQVRTYARAATVDTRFPEQALPCVLARATRKANRGMEGATGNISAQFTVLVGVVVADLSRTGVSDDVWDYLSAIETCLVQHGALGGFSVAVAPGDSTPEDLPISKSRTLAAGSIELTVIVDAVMNAYGGPTTPPDDPYEPLPDDPQVATATVDAQPFDD